MIRPLLPMFLWKRIEANMKNDRFPPIFAWKYHQRTGIEFGIKIGFTWVDSPEGSNFWNDIDDLLRMKHSLTEEKIREVFVKHGVEIN